MIKIAKIRGNDEQDGKIIFLGIEKFKNKNYPEIPAGYKIVASNGDDVSAHYLPQTKRECKMDIAASFEAFETFEWL